MNKLSYFVFFLVWLTLPKAMNAIEVDDKTQAKQTQAPQKCTIDLDLRECPIQINEYISQANKLTSELAFLGTDNNIIGLKELQYAEIKYASVISAINDAVTTEDCVIAGMRFFNTLDRASKGLKIYCSPVYAYNPTKTGSYYYFNLNSLQETLSDIISAKSTPVYLIENGELSNITSNQTSLDQASQRWSDYKSFIRIDKTFLPGMRGFKEGDDFYSFFFPLEEFEVSQQSANNQSTFFVVSSVKKISGKYYNVINFANVAPTQVNYPTQRIPTSDVDVDYFIGMASNLAQLCPVKCDRLKATKVDGKEIYKLVN